MLLGVQKGFNVVQIFIQKNMASGPLLAFTGTYVSMHPFMAKESVFI